MAVRQIITDYKIELSYEKDIMFNRIAGRRDYVYVLRQG